jgi:hypothetical protein
MRPRPKLILFDHCHHVRMEGVTVEKRLRAEAFRLLKGVLVQATAESSAAQMRRNRQLGKLIDSISHGDQRNASYGFSGGVRHEDMTAFQENRVYRVVEGLAVFGFKSEILRDPLFVQRAKRGRVIYGSKRANLDRWRNLFHSIIWRFGIEISGSRTMLPCSELGGERLQFLLHVLDNFLH